MLPIVFAILVAVSIVVGFVLWATADLDRHSLERETALVTRIMSDEIAKIPHDQQSVAIGDEAVENTAVHFDRAWVDANLGSRMASYFGHDEVFILDAADRPVYAMTEGHADPMLSGPEIEDFTPLVGRMRQLLAGGALDAYQRGAGPFPAAVDLMLVGNRPAIVGIAPLSNDSRGRLQSAGAEFLHVSVVLLTDAYARDIADRYQLRGAHFTITQSNREGQAYYPLINREGRFIAFFEWQPDRPGLLVLARTAPGVATGFVIAGIVIFLLLNQLWRSAAVLHTDRLNAQHRARHDPLTGLPNRTGFEARLAAALRLEERRENPLALLMLDLDRFKQVNDTLGHQAGDELIQAVSQRLRNLVRPSDTIARIGGDEFAVIHLAHSGEPGALQLSEKIIEALSKPFDVFGREAFVGVSIGVAVAEPDDDGDRLELIRRGDIALHEAKASGRNRAVVFTETMSELLQGRHAIESELREALRWGDQISVAYQPLFSRESGEVIGAEALARWTHPRLGLLSPALFIPVAEATGLIEALGDVILRESCLLGTHWPGRTIAVNISPSQLRNPAFPGRVFELLKTTGMRAADLELEITEGILLEESPEITDALSSFRAAGIRIALDDFGTGYSSLNYLKRYPVERIKIDRSFVSQLASGNSSVAIVQAMVTLAHALGISVTAEGVETEEQKAILSGMGCNTFQGYLLSAPVSRPMIERMFRDAPPTESPVRKAVA